MTFTINIHEPSFRKVAKKHGLAPEDMGDRIRQQTLSAILNHDWETLAFGIDDKITNKLNTTLRIVDDGRGLEGGWHDDDPEI
jgi:hypothetical protein